MKIRNFKKEDLFHLAELAKEAEIIDLSQKQIYRVFETDFNLFLKPFSVALVAEEKKKIIGFIILEQYEMAEQGIIAEIGYFVVDGEHQRKKIGTKLFKEAVKQLETKLSEEHFSLRLIKVEVDGNQLNVQNFYSSLGMKKVAEIPDYWDEGEGVAIFIKRFN